MLTEKEINKAFLEFLKHWKEVTNMDVVPESFKRQGLCYNFKDFLKGLNIPFSNNFDCYNYIDKLTGVIDYPFNQEVPYDIEYRRSSMHLNPKRIAFVDAQIERLEKLLNEENL